MKKTGSVRAIDIAHAQAVVWDGIRHPVDGVIPWTSSNHGTYAVLSAKISSRVELCLENPRLDMRGFEVDELRNDKDEMEHLQAQAQIPLRIRLILAASL